MQCAMSRNDDLCTNLQYCSAWLFQHKERWDVMIYDLSNCLRSLLRRLKWVQNNSFLFLLFVNVLGSALPTNYFLSRNVLFMWGGVFWTTAIMLFIVFYNNYSTGCPTKHTPICFVKFLGYKCNYNKKQGHFCHVQFLQLQKMFLI